MNIDGIRQTVEDSIAHLTNERDKLDDVIGGLEKFLSSNGDSQAVQHHLEIKEISLPIAPPEQTKDKAPKGIAPLAQHLLTVLGPMKTPQLLDEMKKRGHPVKGKRPIQTLYGVLSKDAKSAKPRVIRDAKGRWKAVLSK